MLNLVCTGAATLVGCKIQIGTPNSYLEILDFLCEFIGLVLIKYAFFA